MQLILNDTFWKFLVSLEELTEKKDKALFCASLDVDEDTLAEFQEFLSRFDVIFENDDAYIYPLKDKCRMKMEFTLSEWFALQASFRKDGNDNHFKYYYQKIV